MTQKTRVTLCFITSLFVLNHSISQADPRLKKQSDDFTSRVILIEPETLQKTMHEFILIDARSKAEYQKKHIPDSHSMIWEEWTEETPGVWNWFFGKPSRWGKITKNATKVVKHLRSIGINNDSKVVVIGDPKGWGEEGRIGWNLLVWGLKKVYLLNGGYPAWQQRYPEQTTSVPASVPKEKGSFQWDWHSERRVEMKEVRSLIRSEASLFDVRSPEEFAGKRMKGQKRGGHLPGAQLVPLKALYQENGDYVSKEILAKTVEKLEDLLEALDPGQRESKGVGVKGLGA